MKNERFTAGGRRAGVGSPKSQVSFAALIGVAIASAFAPNAASAQEASQTTASPTAAGNQEEIVVTAQRREERLVDVPVSMTVLGGERLDGSNARGVIEELSRVPGVNNGIQGGNFRQGSPAGGIVIRGVAPSAGAGTTGYYLDSVPWGFVNSSLAPDANVYDLERVEVLRGPQGTLYGANALNGVVRVLTHEPDLDEFQFKARTSISGTEGGGVNYRGDAAVNLPIVDNVLAIRAVVGFQDLSGWLDNPGEDDANSTEVDNYRVRVAFQPTDRLSLGLLSWVSRTDVGAPSNSPDGQTRPSLVDERAALDFDLLGFNVGYDFDEFTFTSSTSHIDFRNPGRFDYRPFAGFPLYNNFSFESRVFSQEFALASTGEGDWRWSLGAIYRDAEDYNYLNRNDPATGAQAGGYLAPRVETWASESIAIFGELTRLLLDDKLELTLGLRQFHDDTEYTEISRNTAVGGVPPTGLLHSTGEFEHLTPRLVAAYHPSPDSTLYASYSEGFRSGISQNAAAAINLGYPPAEPDELSNYEVGYRGSAWNGRVSFETAVFYIDWQGVQQQLGLIIDPTTVPPTFGVVYTNAGSVNGWGIDAGVTAEVLEGLVLNGAFSWNNLEVAETAGGFTEGSRLFFSPEYTVSAGVDYTFPLGGGGLSGHLSASANYVPEQIIATSPLVSYAEAATNARASFGIEGERWTAMLFGENLTNDDGLIQDPFRTSTNPAGTWTGYQRPRTVGIQVEYKY